MADDIPAEAFKIILKASKDNDVETMKAILAINPAFANASNGIQQTGLHVAAIWGCLEVALELIDAGADINAQNQFGVTPLASAVDRDQHTMVQMLLDEKANPNIRAGNGALAIEAAKSNAIRMLLGGKDLKAHGAITGYDIAALDALLRGGTLDLSDTDSKGDTALHLAVKAATGEEVDDKNVVVMTPAQEVEACVTGHKLLELLCAHADATKGFAMAQRTLNQDGKMPLHIAAAGGNAKACDSLLGAKHPTGLIDALCKRSGEYTNGQWGKKGANGHVEKLSSAGSSALHLAVQVLADAKEEAEDADEDFAVDAALVKLLLDKGATANVIDADLATPLHIAIMGGLHEVVELLCNAKADLSLGCKAFGKDNTSMHQAVLARDVTTIKLLAKHGAPLDAKGRDGWTPLCMAVRSNAVDVLKTLLEAKASPHVVSGTGKTPLEVASINSKAATMELLQQALGSVAVA